MRVRVSEQQFFDSRKVAFEMKVFAGLILIVKSCFCGFECPRGRCEICFSFVMVSKTPYLSPLLQCCH